MELKAILCVLTLLALVVSAEAEITDDQILALKLESLEDFSADYKQGYVDAAVLYKPLATMDGMLQATKSLLDVFREAADDGGSTGELASGFIEVTAPTYNKEVAEYNEFVVLMNSVIEMRIGPGHDDLKFGLAPFFY